MARTDVKQANFLLPVDLIEELRRSVPKREQSKMVAEALRNELRRMRLRRALVTSFGAWTKEAHPELEQGVDEYVRELRRSYRDSRIAEE
ncbi:MAG: hypothetical protein HY675_23785 [Chloroflexi bacterium]|nr:hypothetical protein [Chloroflexota bacterium]